MLNLREKLQKCNSGYKGVGNLLISKDSFPSIWNILQENVSLPAATLSKSALDHNQLWMEKFAENFRFQLAPHGKTTMLPELFKQQVSSPSCWGMTLATAAQVAAAFNNGIKRVLLANQLVGLCNMDIISTILEKDPEFEFVCLVDSVSNIAQLGNFFQGRGQHIKVLLEYGVVGGRTGIRNATQENGAIEELKKWKNTICCSGVEFFEGILKEEDAIRSFINWPLSRIEKLLKCDVFANKGEEVIITGAGTAWFDIVADDFQKFEASCSIHLTKIIRSGCYLIYDNGLYTKMEERVLNLKLQKDTILSEKLKPALKIWGYVQSIPEPKLAIIGMGRRDCGTDSGFPAPSLHYRPNGTQKAPVECKEKSWEIFNMMDQHTFMKIGDGDDLQVGDILAFDIYHPCTTLDKWRNVLLTDDHFNVLDVFNSEF